MAGRVGRRGLGAFCARLESLSLAPARGIPRLQAQSPSQSQAEPHANPESHEQAQAQPQAHAEPMPQSRDPGSNQWQARRPAPLLHSASKPQEAFALPIFSNAGSSSHIEFHSTSQPSSSANIKIRLPLTVDGRAQNHRSTAANASSRFIAALQDQKHPFTPGIGRRHFSRTAGSFQAAGPLLALNTLRPAKDSTHNTKRLGRGIGSGKGKTAGRGHKGQKSRSGNKPRIGFEGGQTPLRLRLPKRGFHNPFSLDFQVVNLRDVIEKVDGGAIDPASLITMKTLKEAGLGGKATRDGVKLLAGGAEAVSMPLHFEVSRVSETAREAVEKAGGSVTRVHYNKLGLRALLQPEWFAKKGRLLPRPARPPPRIRRLGLVDAIGRLPAPTTPLTAEAS